MLDKYHKIQDLIDRQKKKKQYLESIFENIFNIDLKMPEKIKYDVIFGTESNGDSEIKVKIKDKSSVKFLIEKHKQKIIDVYLGEFPKDIIIIK